MNKEFYKIENNKRGKALFAMLRNDKSNVRKVLKDINITVQSGTSYGILGANGSGKSTLLKLIHGTMQPTSGSIICNGTVEVLNISAGIVDSYTGIENIIYKCTLMGMTSDQAQALIPGIVEYSELGEQIYEPVSTYSAGMRAKLGFSIAIMISPDILIIDEGLAVGDAKFNKKSFQSVLSLINDSKTFLFVSHNIGQIRQMCNKCCWLNQGELIAKGDSYDITSLYDDYMQGKIELEKVKELVAASPATYYKD